MSGGSWAKTRSTAEWVKIFEAKNITISPLESANSGYNTISDFSNLEGEFIKNIIVKFQKSNKREKSLLPNTALKGAQSISLIDIRDIKLTNYALHRP